MGFSAANVRFMTTKFNNTAESLQNHIRIKVLFKLFSPVVQNNLRFRFQQAE